MDLAGYAYVGGYAIVTAPARLARGTINFVDRFSRMDWEQRILTVTQPLFQTALHFSPQGMLKSWLSQAQSYWDYANDPFSGNWAAWNYITSGGTDGLAYQTGDFIGTNLTIGAITGAAGAPFAGGGGGVTTIFPEGVPTTPNPNILSYRSKYQGGPYPRGQFGRGGPLWQQDSTYRSGQVRAERIVHDAGRQMGLNVHQLVDEILYIPESRSPFFTVENGQRILGMNKNAVFGSDPSLRTLKAGHELGHAYVYDNRHIVGSLSYEAEEIAVEGLARNKLGNSLSQRALRNSIRYENTFRKILVLQRGFYSRWLRRSKRRLRCEFLAARLLAW